MLYKIYFSVNDYDDSFIVEAETVDEIKEKVIVWLASRGLTEDNITGSEKL